MADSRMTGSAPAPVRPWREYRVLDVLDSGRGEPFLIGHEVMLVRELPAPAPDLPRGYRAVEVFHYDQLFTLIGRFRIAETTCYCPARPFPHRWTRKCHASQP